MRKVIDFLLPWRPVGGMLGKIAGPLALLIVILSLVIPAGPTSLTKPGGEPSRRGDTSGFQVGAGAGISFASPGGRLAALGIPYREELLRPGDDYTPGGLVPRAIVVHNTDSPAALGCGPVYNTFVGPTQASTHFCIEPDGTVWGMVPLDSIAWGNGDISSPNMGIPLINEVVSNGWWMNQYTWSIELALDYMPNTEHLADYPRMQESLTVLVKFLAEQGGFPLNRNTVLTHRDINGAGRVDPICCWRPGGLAAGAQAFDSWVTGLSAPSPVVSAQPVIVPASRSALRVYQAGPNMFYVAAGELTHIASVEALAALWPYEVLSLPATVYQAGAALYVATDGALAHIPDAATLARLWPYVVVKVG